MSREVTSNDDLIDSRDVIARIEELQGEREALADELIESRERLIAAEDELETVGAGMGEAEEGSALYESLDGDAETLRDQIADLGREVACNERALAEWDESPEAEELAALVALAEEGESYADDWPHGCTLIRDRHFEDYARELCEDIGDLPSGLPHYIVIDWEATARNIRMDYAAVDFGGETYWVR